MCALQAVELRPGDVDAPTRVYVNRLVVRELAVPALGLAIAVPRRDRRQTGRLPDDAGAGDGATVQQQLDLVGRREVERLADEVGVAAIRAERDDGVAARVVRTRTRHVRVVRELRDARQVTLGECARPRAAAVDAHVLAAAV